MAEESPKTDAPISHERVAKNTLIYIVGQLVSWAMTLLSVSIIPRRLGETGMGQLAIAGTTVGAVANMMMLGLDGFISAEIGRNRPASERIVQAFMGLRLCLLPLLALISLSALALAHVSFTIWQIGLITLASVSVAFVFAPLRAVLMGWKKRARFRFTRSSWDWPPSLRSRFWRAGRSCSRLLRFLAGCRRPWRSYWRYGGG